MAVSNFIQSIWSKKIQDDLELKTKLVQNCLRDYEGDCKYAASVKILGVGEPTIGKYDSTQDINIEEMTDRGQLLSIDQANYFAFYVDDINQAQSVPGLKEKVSGKGGAWSGCGKRHLRRRTDQGSNKQRDNSCRLDSGGYQESH